LIKIDYFITCRGIFIEIGSPRHKTGDSVREKCYFLSAGSTRLELATSSLTERSFHDE